MSGNAKERKRTWKWTGRNAICEYAFSMQSKKHIGKASKEKERKRKGQHAPEAGPGQ